MHLIWQFARAYTHVRAWLDACYSSKDPSISVEEVVSTGLHVIEGVAATKLIEPRDQGVVGSLDIDVKHSNPLYDPRTISIDSIYKVRLQPFWLLV